MTYGRKSADGRGIPLPAYCYECITEKGATTAGAANPHGRLYIAVGPAREVFECVGRWSGAEMNNLVWKPPDARNAHQFQARGRDFGNLAPNGAALGRGTSIGSKKDRQAMEILQTECPQHVP